MIENENVFQVILGEMARGDELGLLYGFTGAEVSVGRTAIRAGDEEPVCGEGVEVRIEAERVGVALYAGEGAEVVRVLWAIAGVDVVNVVGFRRVRCVREASVLIVVAERLDEEVEGVGERVWEVGEVRVKRAREGEHPLATPH